MEKPCFIAPAAFGKLWNKKDLNNLKNAINKVMNISDKDILTFDEKEILNHLFEYSKERLNRGII